MPDRWGTYAFEFRGGLISNLSPLQHGIQAPGSARILRNFEPSVDGGYRRIQGYVKYDANKVPAYGSVRVQGSAQTGTTLVIANVSVAPLAGDKFTIAGVTGEYTIASAGVSYNSTTKIATLTLTTSLASSPADKAVVTFSTNNNSLIYGLAAWKDTVIACRNGNVFTSSGVGWTKINNPVYGTVTVSGGSQAGSSLIVAGLTEIPQRGDTFTIAGVEKVYTVVNPPTLGVTTTSIDITPSLASSPANGASITFLCANRTSIKRHRFAKYRLGITDKIAFVDSTNKPFIWDGSTFKTLTKAPSDVDAAEHIAFFKNQLFFSKGSILSFTSPYSDDDFNVANGAGAINVGGKITGLVVFREQLIIFSENKIQRLVGNTLADFVLQPITDNIGCVSEDTIQEVGSDVMFLGPDGLRLLSATDRIGDFNLASVSKSIQTEITSLTTNSETFSSVVIKKKSQYRLFGYKEATAANSSVGIIGTQLATEEGITFNWAETQGIKAFVSDSDYTNAAEAVVFANTNGYVYGLERGTSFDGSSITATFATPFVPITDPLIRKTFYKLVLYLDTSGAVEFSTNLKLDFDEEGIVQPEAIDFINFDSSASFYGNAGALYGTATYGTRLQNKFQTQVIGSGFTVSLQFISSGSDAPFSLDAATLEYANFDRR